MKGRNTVNTGMGYQPTTQAMSEDNPPIGGNSVQRPKSSIGVTVNVDTSEVDRLAIGGRMYDALTWKSKGMNFDSIIGIDREDNTITIKETELLKLIQLANKYHRDSRIKLI